MSGRAALAWARRHLFPDWGSAMASLAVFALVLYAVPPFLDWALLRAEWRPDVEACRALDESGACWGVIAEKWRLILFGRYPFDQHWRPALAIFLALAAFVITGLGRLRGLALAWMWGACLFLFILLMRGGIAGLPRVDTGLWGGLALNFLLAMAGMAGAFPLAIGLALGRTSSLPLLRALCSAYVELVRGMPLVPTLFMAAFLFPLFLPGAWGGDLLLRVLIAIVLFAAAYLAEVVRGGLQAIGGGQAEAAAALGLDYWQIQRHIVLPQALRAALPALVGSFISLFKDVSLVTVVSLYELTGSLSLALAGDARWRPYYLEGYLFIGGIYWLGCFGLSLLGQALERRNTLTA